MLARDFLVVLNSVHATAPQCTQDLRLLVILITFDGNPKMRKFPLKQFSLDHHTPNNLSHRSMQQFHQNSESKLFFSQLKKKSVTLKWLEKSLGVRPALLYDLYHQAD